MANKVKPFYIRITDDMTPQMVQDAFDKCVDAGAIASDCVERAAKKNDGWHYYGSLFDWKMFGVCEKDGTYLADDESSFSGNPQEITLDQLDEWLGIAGSSPKQVEWDGEGLPPVGTKCEVIFPLDTTPRWYQCTIDYSCQDVGVFDIEGEKCAFTTAPSNGHSVEFRKPETPEQKAERKLYEAIEECYNLAPDGLEIPINQYVAKLLYQQGYRKQ